MISRSAYWPTNHTDIVEGRGFELRPFGKVLRFNFSGLFNALDHVCESVNV